MSKPILKFRCYQCSKLLGVSPSKAGRTTTCPNCKAELIVPEPDEPEVDVPAIAIDPGPEPIAPTPAPKRRPEGDRRFSWEEIDQSLFRTIAESVEADAVEPAIATPDDSASSEPLGEVEPTPDQPPSVLDVRVEPPEIKAPRQSRRAAASEVTLSQSVLASWSIFALLAMAISFVAGLFVGHFVWK